MLLYPLRHQWVALPQQAETRLNGALNRRVLDRISILCERSNALNSNVKYPLYENMRTHAFSSPAKCPYLLCAYHLYDIRIEWLERGVNSCPKLSTILDRVCAPP